MLSLLGVKVSNDTIQRLYDRFDFIDDPDVEEIGIDDDETLKEWLKNHQKVRLVARDRASAYASAISAILPECVQVADRFHLLQNLLEHLKDIFKTDMPATVYIKDGKVLEKEPEKILLEKTPDHAYLSTINYNCTPPQNPDGSERIFDNKKHHLETLEYKKMQIQRKKNRN